jgi:hypothetical protein
MNRPLVFVGVDRQQAREAALAVCARAVSGDEARQLLRCLGLIPDPAVKGGQLGNPACHPLGDRGTELAVTHA